AISALFGRSLRLTTNSLDQRPARRLQLFMILSARPASVRECRALLTTREESMNNRFDKTVAASAVALVCLASIALAQAPAPAATPASTVVANPTYISIPLEINVNRPAAEVWKRVGKYCDIGEWLRINCTITSGKDGEFGAVRSVAGEVLVGKTELSYTYTQAVSERPPHKHYH